MSCLLALFSRRVIILFGLTWVQVGTGLFWFLTVAGESDCESMRTEVLLASFGKPFSAFSCVVIVGCICRY